MLELKARFAEAEAKIASSDAEALRLRANAASLRSDAADLLANDEVDWLSAQLHADAAELRASWAVLEAKAMEKEAARTNLLQSCSILLVSRACPSIDIPQNPCSCAISSLRCAMVHVSKLICRRSKGMD